MKMEEKKKNKVLNFIIGFVKFFLGAFLVTFILVVLVQRFTKNNFAVGGYRVFTVISESMKPDYVIGDILIVKSVDPDTLLVGDDVCYLGDEEDFDGKIVTHRIKEVVTLENGEVEFITEGIANVMPDPQISEDQIYGKVVYKTKVLSLMSKLASNTVTFFLVVFIPILIFIILEAKELFSEIMAKRLEKELESDLDDEDDDDEDDDDDSEEVLNKYYE